ncbi:hypothetical protein [uncultured Bacteroides sp.]|uniref:hypothetical protein n=1 Tax=uncultured Bacteroides sp. TaxID=162156 RepID=UPI0023CA8E96|nr:hypothetical protein [uncultured Bacteroides sp.]MDE5701220.1 hypothetical protein [Bacteroides sp.]
MRNKRLQNRITAGRFTLPTAIILSLFGWMLTSALLPEMPATESGYSLWQTVCSSYIPTWANTPLSFILYSIIGYFLIELNNTFAIIRMRASVQTSIYFLLMSVCPALHRLYAGDIASVAFLISLFFLFQGYQHTKPEGPLFYSFLFIGVGSLVFPQLTLFIPLFWIGAHSFQALTLKSFFGSLTGWFLPYWFLFGHAYFHDKMELFYQPFIELGTFHAITFSNFPLWEAATLGYLFLLFAVSSVHCLVAGYEDKIRTRSYLQFLIFLSLCIFGYILLQPMLTVHLLPLLLIGVSILAGHFVVLTNSRASNVFFICALAGLVLLFGFNLWTLL